MDYEKKYKDLLVEAWSWDSECLMLIRAIESSTIEEAEVLIDNLVDVLTRQTNLYKKKMKAEHDEALDKVMEEK